ncbi:MAG: 50S ribosomal protein L24 [Acidobacteriota bacterium]
MASKVKKNDQVKVLAGKDRGKTGRVLQVLPAKGLAVVEGIHYYKRHTRPNPSKNIKGGIVEREGVIHLSNIMVICPQCKQPSRLGRKLLEDGRRVRVCRGCGAELDR